MFFARSQTIYGHVLSFYFNFQDTISPTIKQKL